MFIHRRNLRGCEMRAARRERRRNDVPAHEQPQLEAQHVGLSCTELISKDRLVHLCTRVPIRAVSIRHSSALSGT